MLERVVNLQIDSLILKIPVKILTALQTRRGGKCFGSKLCLGVKLRGKV